MSVYPPPSMKALTFGGLERMAKIAMKFGGTSVADLDRIRHVAALVKRERDRGNEVAVVVSAMAGETNKLVGWASEIAKSPGSNFPAMPDQSEQDVIVAAGSRSVSAWGTTDIAPSRALIITCVAAGPVR